MKTEEQWLAAYIYYAEPWEKLLTDVVHPLVDLIMSKRLAEQFFFVRYWEKGPHIRLRFKGDKSILNGVVKPLLIDHIERFLTTYPSARRESNEITSLSPEQQWYPNNSIQFIPYEQEVERYGGSIGMLISEQQFQASSNATLDAIAHSSSWDYDKAMGVAVQLHLTFAFACEMSLEEVAAFFDAISQRWFHRAIYTPNMTADEYQQRAQVVMQAFEVTFDKQEPLLLETHSLIWNGLQDDAEFEYSWTNLWIEEMKKVYRELVQAQSENRLTFPRTMATKEQVAVPKERQQLWAIYESYIHMTNNRLGILNRDEAYLGYVIAQSIKRLNTMSHLPAKFDNQDKDAFFTALVKSMEVLLLEDVVAAPKKQFDMREPVWILLRKTKYYTPKEDELLKTFELKKITSQLYTLFSGETEYEEKIRELKATLENTQDNDEKHHLLLSFMTEVLRHLPIQNKFDIVLS